MKRLRLLAVLPLAACLALGGAGIHRAGAAPLNYDVEAASSYCAIGGFCTMNDPNYTFFMAQMDAYTYYGASSSTFIPNEVYLRCDRFYTDAGGVRRHQWIITHAYPGNGYIGGYVRVSGGLSENPPSSTNPPGAATVYFSYVSDPARHTYGTAIGSDTTDNYQDALIYGQISIHVTGTTYQQHVQNGAWVGDPPTTGSIVCATQPSLISDEGETELE